MTICRPIKGGAQSYASFPCFSGPERTPLHGKNMNKVSITFEKIANFIQHDWVYVSSNAVYTCLLSFVFNALAVL